MHKRIISAKIIQSDLNKYQKNTDKQHILDNPDTYIGSVEVLESDENMDLKYENLKNLLPPS